MAASVTVDVTVLGIKDALKQINSIDPKLRRAITKEYKSIVAPIVKSAQDAYPELPPMSGWSRAYKSLGAWDAGKVKKGVQAKVNTRKHEIVTLLKVQTMKLLAHLLCTKRQAGAQSLIWLAEKHRHQ